MLGLFIISIICSYVHICIITLYGQNQLVIKISSPIRIRITPPIIPALSANLVPTFLPIIMPARHMAKVTVAINTAATTAFTES